MNRGEIWWANFDPTIGSEIRKLRPAVIISRDGMGKLPIRVVVPLTEWRAEFEDYIWMVKLIPSWENGLDKTVAADGLQVRAVSTQRLSEKKGHVTPQELADIVSAVGYVIDHPVA
jgi:mRNA interferase MazF